MESANRGKEEPILWGVEGCSQMTYARMGRMRTLRRAGQFQSRLQGTDLLSFHAA